MEQEEQHLMGLIDEALEEVNHLEKQLDEYDSILSVSDFFFVLLSRTYNGFKFKCACMTNFLPDRARERREAQYDEQDGVLGAVQQEAIGRASSATFDRAS
jgi:hypothetical protein